MKLTKKEDYTFYFLSLLVKNHPSTPLSLTKASKESGISLSFLKQIVRPLVKKKLLISKEGIGGGYQLSQDPKDISLYEIFLNLDSLPILTQCCSLKNNHLCQREKSCKPGKVWMDLNDLIINKLKNTKLSELN